MDIQALSETNIEVVKAYASADMRVSPAARKCNMHDNTVRYHLRVVKKKTGKDPRRFWQLVAILDALMKAGKM